MNAVEIEAQLVGAVLDSEEPMKLLQASGLEPEDFQDKHLRTVWEIARRVAARGGRAGAIAVFGEGLQTKSLGGEDIGLLQSMASRNALDTKGFVELARQLRRVKHTRYVAEHLKKLGDEVGGGRVTPAQLHTRTQALLAAYERLHTDGRRGGIAVESAFGEFDKRLQNGSPAIIPTGIDLFDEKTGGGLPPKLCALLGPPGVGKSAILGSILEQQLLAGLTVLLFSLEDGDEWLVKRHLAKRLGMPVKSVFAREFPDPARASDVGAELAKVFDKLWIVTKTAAPTAADVIRIATQYVLEQGVQCVWLDNATALKHAPTKRYEEPRNAAGRMYESFATWADTYRRPFVALAHTTRKYDERTRTGPNGPPSMSEVAETADAERAIRLGLGLWRKHGKFRLTVLKSTESEPGTTFEFGMHHEAALVDTSECTTVNLRAEQRKEREQARNRKDEESVAQTLNRKRLADEMKRKIEAAAVVPEPPPQLDLLGES